MNDSVLEPISHIAGHATAELFMWRGGGVALFGQPEDGRWVLARAWLNGDRLEHIRRWSFAEPIAFSGQVRRLVMEACEDAPTARAEGSRALAWSEAIS
ncbi:MAG: hypothetical protein U0031_05330 [Thermomicrobiales bacterium]